MDSALGTVTYVTWPPLGVDERAAERYLSGLRDRLHFLVLEVRQQLEATQVAMAGSAAVEEQILAREDYIDNLKSTLENSVYAILGEITDEHDEESMISLVRAVNVIATNLERIADFCVNIVGQLRYIEHRSLLREIGCDVYFDDMIAEFSAIEEGLWQRDMQRALGLCRCEERVDGYYRDAFNKIMVELRVRGNPEELVTALFIFRYLERAADSLLNIGEAILFAALGERVKISHFEALESSLEAAHVDVPLESMRYEGFWGTRSGSRIGALETENSTFAKWIIYKEGQTQKIQEEQNGIALWTEQAPDLVARVYGMHQVDAQHASLLMEFLRGNTLQSILLEGPDARMRRALSSLSGVLEGVWQKTRSDVRAYPRFVAQMRRRLTAVLDAHPDYATPTLRFGAVEESPFESLLEAAAILDNELCSPFSVLLHGDCNLDNVIVNPADWTLRVIDLHRAKMGDYLQDVSVFLVSNFRVPTMDEVIRERIEWVCREICRFVFRLAKVWGDDAAQARLALGVARSFLTSTRFELHPALSDQMFQRSTFLMRSLLDHRNKAWEEYVFPASIFRV